MSGHLAELIYRFRLPLCAVIAVGFLALLPLTNVTAIDNDISMWISQGRSRLPHLRAVPRGVRRTAHAARRASVVPLVHA